MPADTSVYTVSRPSGCGIRRETSKGGDRWYWGHVRTAHGVVIVYSEARITTIGVIHDGKEYTRRVDRGYGPRHLVTLADRFAKEIADAG